MVAASIHSQCTDVGDQYGLQTMTEIGGLHNVLLCLILLVRQPVRVRLHGEHYGEIHS
jgi:hypothetical protein